MGRISFDEPVFIIAAIFAPFAVAWSKRIFKNAFSLSISLGPPGGQPFRAGPGAEFTVKLCRASAAAGFSMLLIAAGGPSLVSSHLVWLDRGADIIFVIDCSPSMAGIDMENKQRFETAVSLVKKFSEGRGPDAIGLAAVGNDAALLIPQTIDRNVLRERLDSLRIGEMGDGTALGEGLAVAALHLLNSKAPRKVVIIITDGENNAGAINPETAAEMIARGGISLYIIAVGTAGDIPIDYIDPVTNARRIGTFESRYDPDSLAAIAAAGGGVFIQATSERALLGALSKISASELSESRSMRREKHLPLHNIFIMIGAALAAAGVLIKKAALGSFL